LAVSDFVAAEVVRKFEELEPKRIPVDEYLLEQAKRCGLVLTKDYGKLEQISALHRLYSRPYERQPKLQEFVVDAGAVVEIVLGQPTKIEASRFFDQIHLLSKELETLSTVLKQGSSTQQKSNLK
jgi:hypothetical protein